MNKRRVLIIAEAANPEWASVPLVGWSLATAIQRREEGAHIVTQVRNREAFLRAGMKEGEDFTAIDSEKIAAPAYRFVHAITGGKGIAWTLKTAISSLVYPYFEKLVWERFKDEIGPDGYNIIHRVTPLTPTANSSIAKKAKAKGAHFVMGPLNGGVPWPKEFDAARRAEKEWLSYIREFYKLAPGRDATLNNADLIFCGSRHTQSEIPARLQDKCVWLPENAIDPSRFNLEAPDYKEGEPLKVVFVGRLVPYKGPDMLLEAAAPLMREGKVEISIVGDGPMMEGLKQQAATLGIEGRVTFHGMVPHTEVQERFAENHVLGFPSVREFGGGVVLEAMALGVVPLIVDYAGPGELVDERIGEKIPLAGREGIITAFRERLGELVADPARIARLKAAGMEEVRTRYTWDAKAAVVSSEYQKIVAA